MKICQLFLHSMDTKDTRVSTSAFSGVRRPAFSRITLDEFAERLANVGKSKAAED